MAKDAIYENAIFEYNFKPILVCTRQRSITPDYKIVPLKFQVTGRYCKRSIEY